MISRPVDLISSGTVAAISWTAPGRGSGVIVDELSATLAGWVPPDPPRPCQTPTPPATKTNATAMEAAIIRPDTRRLAGVARRLWRPLPGKRTGVFRARRAAAAISAAD